MDGDGFLMGLLLIPLRGVSRQHYKALATSGYLQSCKQHGLVRLHF
jgi:hypothetical protein